MNWIKRQLSKLIHVDIYVINILGLIIGIYLYYKLGEKVEIIGACLATTISISVGLRTYKIEDDKMFKDLFEGFNNKYDEEFNDTLNEINDESTEIDDKLVVDYLNFCAEDICGLKKDEFRTTSGQPGEQGFCFI